MISVKKFLPLNVLSDSLQTQFCHTDNTTGYLTSNVRPCLSTNIVQLSNTTQIYKTFINLIFPSSATNCLITVRAFPRFFFFYLRTESYLGNFVAFISLYFWNTTPRTKSKTYKVVNLKC